MLPVRFTALAMVRFCHFWNSSPICTAFLPLIYMNRLLACQLSHFTPGFAPNGLLVVSLNGSSSTPLSADSGVVLACASLFRLAHGNSFVPVKSQLNGSARSSFLRIAGSCSLNVCLCLAPSPRPRQCPRACENSAKWFSSAPLSADSGCCLQSSARSVYRSSPGSAQQLTAACDVVHQQLSRFARDRVRHRQTTAVLPANTLQSDYFVSLNFD